jgi:hypothetical protein
MKVLLQVEVELDEDVVESKEYNKQQMTASLECYPSYLRDRDIVQESGKFKVVKFLEG